MAMTDREHDTQTRRWAERESHSEVSQVKIVKFPEGTRECGRRTLFFLWWSGEDSKLVRKCTLQLPLKRLGWTSCVTLGKVTQPL
jgi:hypothetical protein